MSAGSTALAISPSRHLAISPSRHLAISLTGIVALFGARSAIAQGAPPIPLPSTPAFWPVEISVEAPVSALPAGLTELTETTPAPNNPWLDYRLTAFVYPPGATQPEVIAGFFAANGTEGDACTGEIYGGKTWKVRFTPDQRIGMWTVQVYLEKGAVAGVPINVADHLFTSPGQSVPAGVTRWTIRGPSNPIEAYVTPYNPSSEGFRARGFLRFKSSDGAYYYKFSNPDLADEQRYFVKTGVDSPENYFAYREFWETDKLPLQVPCTFGSGIHSYGYRHGFSTLWPPLGFGQQFSHKTNDWQSGDPEWVTRTHDRIGGVPGTRTTKYFNLLGGPPNCPTVPLSEGPAGHGVIGSLRYLSNQGVNAIYLIPMNLGGDGGDVWPFAYVPPGDVGGAQPSSCLWSTYYSVKRMQEWNTVIDFAMRRGIMVQIVLHEQEPENVTWLGYSPEFSNCVPPNETEARSLTWARRLYLKQMVAHFGHHLALKWNLCEENSVPTVPLQQFSIPQLAAMAAWIERWDAYHDHPISVHADPSSNPLQLNGHFLYRDILASGTGDWLDATSLQIYGGETGSNSSGDVPSDPGNYNAIVELCRLDPTYFGNRPAVIDVDEQGSPTAGASGLALPANGYFSDMSAPEGRRRLVLYDVLFSGGNIEWYCGNHCLPTDFGGGDQSIDEFRSREPLWQYSARARERLQTVPFWRADALPNDARVSGEAIDPKFGGAEVFEVAETSAGRGKNFHLIYYPAINAGAGPMAGTINMGYAGQTPFFYSEIWINPLTNQIISVSPPFCFVGCQNPSPTQYPLTPPPNWTASPDLICLITRL